MTLAQQCSNIIKDLNRFEPEMLSEPGDPPSHIYPHINKLSPFQWKNRVNNNIRLLEEKLIQLVARPNISKVKMDYSSIYKYFIKLNWTEDLSKYPYIERFDENDNHFDYFPSENYEFNSSGRIYNVIQGRLKLMLNDIADGYNMFTKGITIKTTKDRLKIMYRELVNENFVEDGVEDDFINSLLGKPVISHVRWKNKATLSLFIRALKECNISVSIIRNGIIHWSEASPIFPYDISGKKISGNLKDSSKYEGLRYNKVRDIVEKLKLPPI